MGQKRWDSVVVSYRTAGQALAASVVGPDLVDSARRHLDAVWSARAGRDVQNALPAGPAGVVAVPLAGAPARLPAPVDDPALTDLASALLGAPAVPFGCTYVVKPAGSRLHSSWHQDGGPWAERGIGEAVTLWAALDDCDASAGGLVVVPGSHTGPIRRPAEVSGREREDDLFGVTLAEPALPDAEEGVAVVMAAGDVSAHHPRLVHRSPPNTSGRDRRALVLRFRPAEPA
jgi:hypothetical protein